MLDFVLILMEVLVWIGDFKRSDEVSTGIAITYEFQTSLHWLQQIRLNVQHCKIGKKTKYSSIKKLFQNIFSIVMYLRFKLLFLGINWAPFNHQFS